MNQYQQNLIDFAKYALNMLEGDKWWNPGELADRAARLRRGERLARPRRKRQPVSVRAPPAKVVERDKVKRASLEKQGTLFEGVDEQLRKRKRK